MPVVEIRGMLKCFIHKAQTRHPRMFLPGVQEFERLWIPANRHDPEGSHRTMKAMRGTSSSFRRKPESRRTGLDTGFRRYDGWTFRQKARGNDNE